MKKIIFLLCVWLFSNDLFGSLQNLYDNLEHLHLTLQQLVDGIKSLSSPKVPPAPPPLLPLKKEEGEIPPPPPLPSSEEIKKKKIEEKEKKEGEQKKKDEELKKQKEKEERFKALREVYAPLVTPKEYGNLTETKFLTSDEAALLPLTLRNKLQKAFEDIKERNEFKNFKQKESITPDEKLLAFIRDHLDILIEYIKKDASQITLLESFIKFVELCTRDILNYFDNQSIGASYYYKGKESFKDVFSLFNAEFLTFANNLYSKVKKTLPSIMVSMFEQLNAILSSHKEAINNGVFTIFVGLPGTKTDSPSKLEKAYMQKLKNILFQSDVDYEKNYLDLQERLHRLNRNDLHERTKLLTLTKKYRDKGGMLDKNSSQYLEDQKSIYLKAFNKYSSLKNMENIREVLSVIRGSYNISLFKQLLQDAYQLRTGQAVDIAILFGGKDVEPEEEPEEDEDELEKLEKDIELRLKQYENNSPDALALAHLKMLLSRYISLGGEKDGDLARRIKALK